MIKGLLLAIAFLLLPVVTISAPLPGSLGYNNGANANPHNLSAASLNEIKAPGEEQICIFCHTPHNASAQSTLWNRPALAQADSLYPLYSGDLVIKGDHPGSPAGSQVNSQYTNQDSNIQYPNGASRMCMSCHDGVTAVGTVLNGGALASLTMSAAGTIDLSASHPISFVYNSTVVGDINTGRGGIEYQLPPDAFLAPLDGGSRMQCTTCHEPHFDTRRDSYPYPFWRNAGLSIPYSAAADYDMTCNQCHLAPAIWDPPLPVHGDGL